MQNYAQVPAMVDAMGRFRSENIHVSSILTATSSQSWPAMTRVCMLQIYKSMIILCSVMYLIESYNYTRKTVLTTNAPCILYRDHNTFVQYNMPVH